MERKGDMKIGIVLRLSPIDDSTSEKFGDAVSKLQHRYPLLRLVLSKSKSKKNKLILVPPSDEDARPQTDFHEHGDVDDETWRSLWQSLENQPLNLGVISFRFAEL
jgi:hypothetical protein